MAERLVNTSFPYRWNIADGYPAKNVNRHGLKVFSTFACGGGSTLGYKMAGYNVLGCLEIDPKIIACYKENHHPKYAFEEGIQTFKNGNLPKELFDLDILDGSPPCFAAGNLVMTDKGLVPIENIQEENNVLTHTNEFKPVTKTMVKTVNSLCKLRVQGSIPILVTDEHPFYVKEMVRPSSTGARVFSDATWKQVKDLKVVRKNGTNTFQDYIGIAINNKSKFPEWEGVQVKTACGGKRNTFFTRKTLDLTNCNFWYLIGRWIGDGWTRDKEYGVVGKKDRHDFYICCGKQDKEKLIEKFNLYTDKYSITEQRTSFKFLISSTELCHYMRQFGRGAGNKRITSDILNLPKEQLKYFMEGYLEADGHLETDGKWSCGSISKELIYGIQAIVHKLYKTPTNITLRQPKEGHTIEGRLVNAKISYTLRFSKEPRKQQHGFYENGYIWVPFRELTKLEESHKVYNLSVAENESYTINNLICHNCSNFSMSGNREKDWGKEKVFKEGQAKQVLDTLFFDFIDLAKRLQPKVIVTENVEGLMFGAARDYVKRILQGLDEAGYYVQYYVLDASKMGVPQKRRRVFFIGLRKDLAKPLLKQVDLFQMQPELNLNFHGKEIPYKQIEEKDAERTPLSPSYLEKWETCKIGSNPKVKRTGNTFGFFYKTHPDKVLPTITGGGTNTHYYVPGKLTKQELCLGGSYPLDYNFLDVEPQYLIGMSVPPVMIACISNEIYKQWLSKI